MKKLFSFLFGKKYFSINTTLLFIITLMVTLTVIIVTLTSMYNGYRYGIDQVKNQLNSVSTIKHEEIKTWMNVLENYLYISIIKPEDISYVEKLVYSEYYKPSIYKESYNYLLEKLNIILKK